MQKKVHQKFTHVFLKKGWLRRMYHVRMFNMQFTMNMSSRRSMKGWPNRLQRILLKVKKISSRLYKALFAKRRPRTNWFWWIFEAVQEETMWGKPRILQWFWSKLNIGIKGQQGKPKREGDAAANPIDISKNEVTKNNSEYWRKEEDL